MMIDYRTLGPEGLEQQIRAGMEEVQALYSPLRPDQLRWRASPTRWSVAQCLQHLVITDTLYRDALHLGLEQARQRSYFSDGPFTGSWVGRWFTAQVGPQIGARRKAPRRLRPEDSVNVPDEVAAGYIEAARRLLALLAEARGLDLDRARIRSPVAPVLRLRVIDALRAVAAHDRRHLNQAREILGEPAFPA